MISSLFGKTRPVNYILSLSVLFLFFVFAHVGFSPASAAVEAPVEKTLSLGCLLFSLFIVNFIVQRNQLTATHAYAMLFYGLFAILFPETLMDPGVIFASFFLLLAHRRLISMKSLKNTQAKIFDGALWVLVASLFLNWVLLFLLLVWAYLYFYEPKTPKYWVIPLATTVVAALAGWAVSYLLGDPEFLFRHYSFSPGGVPPLGPGGSWIRIVVFLFLILLAGVLSFLKQSRAGHGKVTQMRLLALGWVFGILVLFLAGDRGGSPVMLTFFPAAVFLGKYVESLSRALVRELVLAGVLLVCLGAFFAQWVLK